MARRAAGTLGAATLPTLTWDDVDEIHARSGLPLIIKGILSAPDASLAVAHGAAGIVVSNHGGRQLDRSLTGLEVLPEVLAAGGLRERADSGVLFAADDPAHAAGLRAPPRTALAHRATTSPHAATRAERVTELAAGAEGAPPNAGPCRRG